jgi:hypothetical protein
MNPFVNPRLDLATNAANHIAYAIGKDYPQQTIDLRVNELIHYLQTGR